MLFCLCGCILEFEYLRMCVICGYMCELSDCESFFYVSELLKTRIMISARECKAKSTRNNF